MKGIKRLLFLIVIIVVVFLVGFEFIYRERSRNFMKADVKQVYINRGIGRHDYTLLKNTLLEEGREDLWKDIDRVRRVLKDVYIFSYDMIDMSLQEEVAVVDTGFAYIGIMPKLTDYFDKAGDYYLLKEERKPRELRGMDIYLKPHRGYFVAGLSKEVIEGFLDSEKGRNETLVKLDDGSKNGLLGKVLMDLTQDKMFKGMGIDGVVTTGSLDKGSLEVINELYGGGTLAESLKNQPAERRYTEYAGKDRIYVSGNTIGDTLAVLLKSINPREIDTLNVMFGMLGVKVEDVFNQIDGEAVVDISENAWIIPLKDSKGVRRIFRFFGEKDRMKYGEDEIRLEGDILMSGEMGKGSKIPELTEKDFLYGDLPMNLFDKSYGEESRGEISGRVSQKGITMKLRLNEEATADFLREALK